MAFWTREEIAAVAMGVAVVFGWGGAPTVTLAAGEPAKEAKSPEMGTPAVPEKSAEPTVLGMTAARMKPGTWAELETKGYTDRLYRREPGSLYQFAEGAVWNPRTRQILFCGGAHAPDPNKWFISYSDATNTWQKEPLPDWFTPGHEVAWHAYDHNALNPATGDYYYCPYGLGGIYKYQSETKKWTLLPKPPERGSWTAAMAYFPEMDGLVLLNGGRVFFWKEGASGWTKLGQVATGGIHEIAEYNPVHKVVLFGGGNGSSDLYKLDSQGKIATLKKAPFTVHVVGHGLHYIAADPVSGKYLAIYHAPEQKNYEWGTLYEYDITTDHWEKLGKTPGGPLVCAPVSTYGVILYMTYGKVYLYKHAGAPAK